MQNTEAQDEQPSGLVADPFDTLLGLEDSYYDEGYRLGLEDGRKAGLAEGRAFGMEKSFEKYAAMGRLHGRAVVWTGRIPAQEQAAAPTPDKAAENEDDSSDFLPSIHYTGRSSAVHGSFDDSVPSDNERIELKQLSKAPRLASHIRILWGLTEPESLAVANEEEGVSDFDDRFKRAVAKARIVGKMVGEESSVGSSTVQDPDEPGDPKTRGVGAEVGIEDINILKVRH